MARWRDTKRGKNIQYKKQNVTSASSLNCSDRLLPRFKAFLTDTFMITMPLIYIVFYFIFGSREEFAMHKVMGWFYIFAPHFSVILTLWLFKQQTPGLKAYDLVLIDSKTGEVPSLLALISRYINTAISIALIIPLILPFFHKQKKTLQDIVSGTCIKQLSSQNQD
jgi:uncharacterized RDD family membrane protein YckC